MIRTGDYQRASRAGRHAGGPQGLRSEVLVGISATLPSGAPSQAGGLHPSMLVPTQRIGIRVPLGASAGLRRRLPRHVDRGGCIDCQRRPQPCQRSPLDRPSLRGGHPARGAGSASRAPPPLRLCTDLVAPFKAGRAHIRTAVSNASLRCVGAKRGGWRKPF